MLIIAHPFDYVQLFSAFVLAERRLLTMMDEYALDEVDGLARNIQDVSERAMRAAIQQLPDGEYRQELQTDGLTVPITIKMALTVRGDRIHIDFAGTSPQVGRALNVVPNYRDAFTMYAIKCVLSPDLPNNEGAFRPITIDAPLESILNPRFPAAGGARVLVGHYLPTLVFGALAGCVPDKIMAATGSPVWCVNVAGETSDRRRFSTMFFFNGGTGAANLRDGYNALTFPSNVGSTPAELMEQQVPWIVERRELISDSGGPGRQRGGLGEVVGLRIASSQPLFVSFLAERTKFPAPGLFGGLPGRRGAVLLNGRSIDPKISHIVQPGDLLELYTPGGGGFGDPHDRDPNAIRDDLKKGYITPRVARSIYGIKSSRRSPRPGRMT